ncbi:uncharacterized protein [Amphiura filiformis]|uniref:uncharacterized protein n=1 Tax=Amphiura filiformis TaxID=82378 RepID=UPI003B21E721
MQSIYAYGTTIDLQSTTNHQKCDENKRHLSVKSPTIFLVGTFRDSPDISTDPQERKVKISEKFESIFDMISDKPYEEHVVSQPYAVENSSNSQTDTEIAGLASLREDIVYVAGRETYMGEKIPLKWLTFEKSVAEAIKEGKHFMELTEVQDISKKLGIEADTVFEMLKFYHNLGTIIYFGVDESKEEDIRDGGGENNNRDLQNMVILDPQWLIGIFRRIITTLPKLDPINKKKWRKLKKEGILEDSLLDHVWSDLLPQKKALIALMEMFDLLCPQEGAEGETIYYVPACLKLFPSEKMHQEPTANRNDITFYIDFQGFLPDGFFNRLLVRAARWSQSGGKPKLYHRYGKFYLDDHNFQLEIQTTKPICIRVTVSKTDVVSPGGTRSSSDTTPDPKACSAVKDFLERALEELTKTWICGINGIRGINGKSSIACPCNRLHPELDEWHFLPLEDIFSKPQINCSKEDICVKTCDYRAWFQGAMTCTTVKQVPYADVQASISSVSGQPKESSHQKEPHDDANAKLAAALASIDTFPKQDPTSAGNGAGEQQMTVASALDSFLEFDGPSTSMSQCELPPWEENIPLQPSIYKMNSKPRGLCLIINNDNFEMSKLPSVTRIPRKRLSDRTGTNIDAMELLKLFGRSLDFEIRCKNDRTARQMRNDLVEIRNINHDKYDCFVCCILTHGRLGHVYGVDGYAIKITDLTGELTGIMCPSLAGKPKVFFINACQGVTAQPSVHLQQDGPSDNMVRIPNEKDFLVCLSTVPGYGSFRSETQGSWFIFSLVAVMKEFHTRVDVVHMLGMVCKHLSTSWQRRDSEEGQQCSFISSSLSEVLFLR